MGLHVRDLKRSGQDENAGNGEDVIARGADPDTSGEVQDKNAGNGGDVIKHSVYLALLDVLCAHTPWCDELHVVEAHAGKGVYVPGAAAHVKAADDPIMRRSKLCAAQEKAFRPSPAGLGSIAGMNAGEERAYAASAVLHAFALRDLPKKSLLLMDCNDKVRKTLARVFAEPAFSRFDPPPRVLSTESSEKDLLDRFRRSCFGRSHVVHLDPFAFVVSQKPKPKQTRERYAELLRIANRRVESGTLGALSVFVVWGQDNVGARADLCGDGSGASNGYQGLRAIIGSERRIVVEWCWGQYFAMLLVVPPAIREEVMERIEGYCKPFERPLTKRFKKRFKVYA